MSMQSGHKRIHSAYNQPYTGSKANARNTVTNLTLGLSGSSNVSMPANKKSTFKLEGDMNFMSKNLMKTKSQNQLQGGANMNSRPKSGNSSGIVSQASKRSVTPSSRGFGNVNFKSNAGNSKPNNSPFTKVKKIDLSPSPNSRAMTKKTKSFHIPKSSRDAGSSFNPLLNLNLSNISKSKLNETGITSRNSNTFRSTTPDLRTARSKNSDRSPSFSKSSFSGTQVIKKPNSKSPGSNLISRPSKKNPFDMNSIKQMQMNKNSNSPIGKKITSSSSVGVINNNSKKLTNVSNVSSLNKKFGTPGGLGRGINGNGKKVITGSLMSSSSLQQNNTTNDVSTNSTFKSKIDNGTNNSSVGVTIGKSDKNEKNEKHEINSNLIMNSNANSYTRMNMQKEKEHKIDFREITTSPLLRKKPDVGGGNNNNPNPNPNPSKNFLQESSDTLLNNAIFNKFNINPSNQNQNSKSVSNNSNPPIQNNLTNLQIQNLINSNNNSNNSSKCKKSIKLIHEFSHVGFSGYGVKKVNQDNFFVFKNFVSNPNHIYMAVCDGHGVLGHEVSGYLRENLPLVLNHQLKINNKNVLLHKINSIVEDVFLETNYKLQTSDTIDTTFSGSTCVSLIYTPEKIISANVGDSRAVLGRCVNGEWESHDLTRDHKPDEKDESARIKKRGGRIQPFKDEDGEFIGPPRVWLKEEEIPGLAMSRSFGDRVAASVGVVAEPEIFEYKFQEEDKFFIVASDGVWEFIESAECINIIKEFYLQGDIVGCCEYIYKESCARWMREEEVIDDITMIIVFLD